MAAKHIEEIKWDRLDDLARLSREEVEIGLVDFLNRSAGPQPAHQKFKPALARLRQLESKLCKEFLGRDECIRAVLASMVSGVPAVLLGPPGTAKSAIVRRIAECCDLRPSQEGGAYFEYLLTDHTMPEELFGAPDLAELQKGTLKRVVSGKLPEAEIAFLDEVFRGGSHILNTLLSIVNERLFHDGASVIDVPLLAVIGASNHPPTSDDATAFFDRFPARIWLDSVFEDRQKKVEEVAPSLLAKSLSQDVQRLKSAWSPVAKATTRMEARVACTHDFRASRVLCILESRSSASSKRLEEFQNLFMDLRQKCALSDRTFGALWRLGTALDLLSSSVATESMSEGGLGHIEVFYHIAPDAAGVRHVRDKVGNMMRGSGHTGDD